MGYIYKIISLRNQKPYIGKTRNTIQERWSEHIYEAYTNNSNFLIHKAMRKYGIDNFIIEQLEECSNDILNEREQYWIKTINSYYITGYGYNMTLGGEGTFKYTDEQILKLWEQGYKSFEIAYKLGANPSTISQRLKYLKPGEAKTRHFNSNKKPVLQYDKYGNFIKEWDSASMAEKELKVSKGSITKCCKKERVIAFNHLWKYASDNTPVEELMLAYANSIKCMGVDRIDKEGNILEQFESAAKAEKAVGAPRGKVSEVCNHKRKQTGNNYWQWSYPLKRELIELNIKDDNDSCL